MSHKSSSHVVNGSAKMPIGIDDFKELMETGCFFVDKSDFISELLRTGSKVTLITRPRRFGKTLNLSMLRYFFSNHQAKENQKLFEHLAVSQDADAMASMGQYPVIMLSLKGVKSPTLDEQLVYFKKIMSGLYEEHMYLYEHLDPINAAHFDCIRQEKSNEAQLAYSLKNLIEFIERYHKKKVVVLIDEYDQPLLNAFRGGFEETFGLFFRNFMGAALKGNNALRFSVVTGIMQMAGSGMFSDFNNADVYNLLDERYATAFGFSEQEVHELLSDQGKKEKLTEVKHWYNGYLFGENHVMYNPWSVLKYVSRGCIPKAYWADTSDNQLLKKELYAIGEGTRARFLALLAESGKILVDLRESLYFSEVGVDKEHALWVLLLSAGYLKAVIKPGSPSGMVRVELLVPNEEVRFIFRHLFQGWLTEALGSQDQMSELATQLVEGRVTSFCQSLQNFFLSSVSSHDVRADTAESFYHGFLLGLFSMINPTHTGHVRSNMESGLGRFDIALEPRNPNQGNPGIIFEIKRLDKILLINKTEKQIEKLLEQDAKKGLAQITEKAYDAELRARGIEKIAHVSLAFCGKQMTFVCKEPDSVSS